MTYITTGGDYSDGGTKYKRVDDDSWEEPLATKHGTIASTADNGSGGTTITCGAAHGMSNGDVVHIFGTTSYDGNYSVSNVAGADFDISVADSEVSETGHWTDDNEYYDNDQYGNITGETVYARFIDEDLGAAGADFLYIHSTSGNGLSPIVTDGPLFINYGTPHRRGHNAAAGSSSRYIIWKGEGDHFDLDKDSNIEDVKIILSYIKSSPV